MNIKQLYAPLFAGALLFGLTGTAQAEEIFMDLGAAGLATDGPTDETVTNSGDGDQVTGSFDELGVFANTTTVQFDTDLSGSLSNGDKFVDSGHLDVGSLIGLGGFDNEGVNNDPGAQITAEWSNLTGTSTAAVLNGDGTALVSTITYDSNNTEFVFYLDETTGTSSAFTFADYGGSVAQTDDVASTFNDGVEILRIQIVGGDGANEFDLAGNFLSGGSVLQAIVISALEDYWFFALGGEFDSLIGSLVEILVQIDQNTNLVINTPGACAAGPSAACDASGVLFTIDSDHNGSISFARIPEPGTLLLFGLGLLVLGGFSLRSRRPQAEV